MKRYLNLMTDQAQLHECLRTRTRQWATLLAAVLVLLIPATLILWWPVHQEGQQVAAMEKQYEPVRRLKEASQSLRESINVIHAQEKTVLTLAQIDTPVISLLGLVGKAVAETNGRAFVEELNFKQNARVHDGSKRNRTAIVEIEGLGLDQETASQLAASLQADLPFAGVQLTSSNRETVGDQQTQRFNIKCTID